MVLPLLLSAVSCAPVDVPDGRTPTVSAPKPSTDRYEGINERRDPITRVNLGRDILVPQPLRQSEMPDALVGPYELRGETLASALQLILDDYDVSIAFEEPEGLTRKITVANLHGKLSDVVPRICSLADLYCHYEDGTVTVKKTETFVVDLPPLSNPNQDQQQQSSSTGGEDNEEDDPYVQIASGLAAVTGTTPTVDKSTRILIYTATQRTNKYAEQYFARLRKNTALIIFETNIWEVTLNNANRTGIQWDALFDKVGGNWTAGVSLPGSSGSLSPISITPAYTGSGSFSTDMVLEFISERGAVKTVSQPQITVLSGAKASLSVSQQENFVSGVSRTPATTVGGNDTVSTTTSTVTTGLTMDVTSAWDRSTVYGKLNIVLDDLLKIDEFSPDVNTKIQLPQTTKRSLETEIRVRPGDAILIGGLVAEKDDLTDSGPGFLKPLFATSRAATKRSTELVFLLRPRVVAFVQSDADTVPIVDADKEGMVTRKTPTADISDKAKGLFAPAPSAPKKTAPKAMDPGLSRFTAPPSDGPVPLTKKGDTKKGDSQQNAVSDKLKKIFGDVKPAAGGKLNP